MPDDIAIFDDFADLFQVERAPRPLFILGAAKIDSQLEEILTSYLLPKSAPGKHPDELFNGDSPLSTFSSKIKMSYRLGLIDETLYKILEKFRAIRNLCAHHITLDFSITPMRDHLTYLRGMVAERKSYKLTKSRYFDDDLGKQHDELQCVLLTICVLLEGVRMERAELKDSRTRLRFLRGKG